MANSSLVVGDRLEFVLISNGISGVKGWACHCYSFCFQLYGFILRFVRLRVRSLPRGDDRIGETE